MKLLTLILMTLFFFAGCVSDNGEDGETPTDEENAGEQTDAPVPDSVEIEMTSVSITCTNDNTVLAYEIRRATSSCDHAVNTCCEFYVAEDGGDQILISKSGIPANTCRTLESIANPNAGQYGAIYFLAVEYQDKANVHMGMNCVREN